MPVYKFMAANAAVKMQGEPKWLTIQYGGLNQNGDFIYSSCRCELG